jgi:hypothetical protein
MSLDLTGFEKIYPLFRYLDWTLIKTYPRDCNPALLIRLLMKSLSSGFLGGFSPSENWIKSIQKELGFQNSNPLKAINASPFQSIDSLHQSGLTRKRLTNGITMLQDLKKRLEKQGIQTVIYLAPMADGEQSFTTLSTLYQGISANRSYRLPNNLFWDYTHLTFDGATLNTKQYVIPFLRQFF